MSSSFSRGGSLDATPFIWSGHASPDPASSLEWLNKDVPDWPLQTGKDSASVSVERFKKKLQNIFNGVFYDFSDLMLMH